MRKFEKNASSKGCRICDRFKRSTSRKSQVVSYASQFYLQCASEVHPLSMRVPICCAIPGGPGSLGRGARSRRVNFRQSQHPPVPNVSQETAMHGFEWVPRYGADIFQKPPNLNWKRMEIFFQKKKRETRIKNKTVIKTNRIQSWRLN